MATKPSYTLQQLHDTESLPCTRCNGTTIITYHGLDLPDRPCSFCEGTGHFGRPDVPDLLQLLKGRKPGKLRSKRPEDDRAYYVWRMARFHGGADVTLPMSASFAVTGDPYVPYLDKVAEAVAQRVYGSDAAGAMRWAHAMGHEVSDRYLDGSQVVPPSALPGGPVVLDNDKPATEALELV